MEDSRVALSGKQVDEEIDEQLGWRVQLRWFASIGVLEIRLRWLAAIAVLAGTWFASSILEIPLPTWPLYALGLCMLAYNALLRLYLERRFSYPRRAAVQDSDGLLRFHWRGLERGDPAEVASFDRFVRLQLSLDWLAMILLVHFSGGVTSPLLFYFVFHLIVASILLSRRDCYLFATLAALAVGVLALLEYGGVIPHVSLFSLSESLHQNGLYITAVLLFFTTSLYLSVYFTATITRNLRKRDEELLRLQLQLSNAYLHIQALYDVAKIASSTLDLKEVLNLIAQSAAEAMQVRACAIMLASKSSRFVDTIAAFGLSQRYLDAGPIDVEQVHYISETLSSGQPTIVPDTRRDDRLLFPDETRAEGIASILAVPLLIRGKAEGVICVYSDEPEAFIDSDAQFLSALASAGASAVENARAYEAVKMADRAKSDFVRMVTHEFRSPLSAVQSMLRLLDTGIVGPLAAKQLDLVERSQQRLSQLLAMVGDLLELAAGKMESLQGEKKEVNLSDLIAKVAELMQAGAEEKGIACKVEVTGAPLTLAGFEEGLERVVMNLVSNAVKYTPPGGSVTVKAWGEGEQIKLEVSDTGIGIPQEALPRLFTEFYRAKNAKAMEVEGTGLGLVIVKDVVDQHGGEISVRSAVGEGTTFSLSLPKG